MKEEQMKEKQMEQAINEIKQILSKYDFNCDEADSILSTLEHGIHKALYEKDFAELFEYRHITINFWKK